MYKFTATLALALIFLAGCFAATPYEEIETTDDPRVEIGEPGLIQAPSVEIESVEPTCEASEDWAEQHFDPRRSGTSCEVEEESCEESLENGIMQANASCSGMLTFVLRGTGSGRNFEDSQFRLQFELEGVREGTILIESANYYPDEEGCCRHLEPRHPPAEDSIEAEVIDGQVLVDVSSLFPPGSNLVQLRVTILEGGETTVVTNPRLFVC